MEIGVRIKQLRKDAGLTQKELSDISGVPVVTIQQYERGVRKQPKIEQLERIAEALKTSISALYGVSSNTDHDLVFYERATALMDNLRDEGSLPADVERYYTLLKDGNISLTEKIAISNTLQVLTNVSLDYLFGFSDEPNTVLRSLPSEYTDLAIDLVEADDDLLTVVHDLCGMNPDLIASDIITGDISETWNPKKIYVIREFLLKNEASIRALITLKLREQSEK